MSRIHPAMLAVAVSILMVGGLVTYLVLDQEKKNPNPEEKELVIYCAAGIKKPVQAIAKEYEEKYNQKIRLDYGGSNTQLAKLKVAKDGDIYIPGDDSYIVEARKAGLVAESIPAATMHAVLLVADGNPKKINTFEDLLQEGVKVGLADPGSAAIGKVTKKELGTQEKWEPLQKKGFTSMGTVNEVASAVKVGSIDVGIVWDAAAANYPEQEQIKIPELENITGEVAIGIIAGSKIPTAALRFARYLTAPETGQPKFKANGFPDVPRGDAWAEEPELVLYGGSMLRPAIEKTVAEFRDREGVRITAKYDGCGNLVSAMEAIQKGGGKGLPDMYFSCDISFMRKVQDSEHGLELFEKDTVVAGNQLMIGVPKGNPKKIQSLSDLTRSGLRIGIGAKNECAMGALTEQTLQERFPKLSQAISRQKDDPYQKIQKNVVVEVSSGDLLIPGLRSGALDAAIVYRSNLAPNLHELEGIPITGIQCAVPSQPLAIGKNTKYPRLMGRLMDALQTETSRKRFEDLGFVWKVGETTDE